MAKTTEEKLVAARALVAKYEAAILADVIAANVQVGDEVSIKFGRGASVREVSGSIVGIADRTAVVLTPELKTFKVNFRDIVSNPAAEARNAAAAPAEAEASDAAGDPLNEA